MQLRELQAYKQYCNSLVRYNRLHTHEVQIGDVPVGGNNPIRIQSMTTTDTMDTIATVEQTLRMVAAGCEYVRITAPSKKEAENLANIKTELRKRGCKVPLVADIHFTPNAAEVAARIVEKVRINPGNFADKKKFEEIDYTDASYQAELERIYQRFAPLVKICKENGTAMRIGTNHGSLSDRIMSRYGDTPEGMVESALEFARICEGLGFFNFVFSMKASNPQVMVQAYRLLAARMLAGETRHVYPLHVGVTEAGDGEDGRIKSAMGIGTLLADGLGDTIRVSLTEPPEAEMPAGRYIRNHFTQPVVNHNAQLPQTTLNDYGLLVDPFSFNRRTSRAVANFGHGTHANGDHHENVPRVISDFSHTVVDEWHMRQVGHVYWPESDKWTMLEQGTDYIYAGSREVPFMLPTGSKAIYDAGLWEALPDKQNNFPYFNDAAAFASASTLSPALNFVRITQHTTDATLEKLKAHNAPIVLVLEDAAPGTPGLNTPLVLRNIAYRIMHLGLQWPIVLKATVTERADVSDEPAANRFALSAASELGLLLVDGLCDGIWLVNAQTATTSADVVNRAAFGLLQSARMRTTKTEYISCPSCGRTLFDLQETTALIRARTEHLKGVKIGIMGCIVNGPGEMADADYGYVGAGPGIISLWRGKTQIKPKVPTAQAVDELIALIKEDDRWVEPKLN
jgi:(E)-4-hydroxy-3-methylbut-2-enyl-diphosphate synthase